MKPWAIKLKVLNSILRKVNSDLVRAEIKVIDFLNLRLQFSQQRRYFDKGCTRGIISAQIVLL